MFFMNRSKSEMVTPDDALAGRTTEIPTAKTHFVYGTPMITVVPEGLQEAMFGMGCFWGVERMFWKLDGVQSTMVGYAAGYTPNPTYEEVCTGKTGHNEVVRVVFDPKVISYEGLLQVFWTEHDPTQGMRQGNDRGTQYRSGIYFTKPEQAEVAKSIMAEIEAEHIFESPLVTEVLHLDNYSAAEDYHQDFFERNPTQGYCMAVAAPKVWKFKKTFSEWVKAK